MVDSLSSWLALREPADVAARSVPLTQALAAVLPRRGPLRVLDLATGTGSNIRYLAEQLSGEQDWLAVDHDAVLLAELPARMSAWAAARAFDVSVGAEGLAIRGARFVCRVSETRRLGLGTLTDATIFSGRQLVTASALLDLVSEPWLRALAERCREGGAAALFALTYNGQSNCTPAEPEDDMIRQLMNRHQKTDKGFAAAAGPDATDAAARCFSAVGYRVQRTASDWILPPDAGDLQRQLIEGWAEAAAEIAPEQKALVGSWLARRLAHVAAGRSRVTVGHEDLAAWLPGHEAAAGDVEPGRRIGR
ncbi:MAG: class I SAM-dependent methyltransferase [Acidobacteriota bacterium]